MAKTRLNRNGDIVSIMAEKVKELSYLDEQSALLNDLALFIHALNVRAGWWTNIDTGEPLDRNVPEMLALTHSEISEGLEAYRKNAMDDHLPHRSGIEVELADAIIRILDLAGGLNLDIGEALVEKLVYNSNRSDHKIENRKLVDGKKI